MSTSVEPSDLFAAVARYRYAYLLTVGGDGQSHVLAVTPRIDGAAFVIETIGRRSRNNLLIRAAVTLLWPADSVEDYSLIVDGQAAAGETAVRITPTRAVLHRPAARPEPPLAEGCTADCIELPLPTS